MVMTSFESHGARFRELAFAGTKSDLDPEAVCVSGPDSEAVCLSGSEMLKGRVFRDVISAHVRLVHANSKRHRRDYNPHPERVFSFDTYHETVCVPGPGVKRCVFQVQV